MLCCSRRRVFQLWKSYKFLTEHKVSAVIPTCRFQQSRTVRTKGGTGFYTDIVRRDERLLKVFHFL